MTEIPNRAALVYGSPEFNLLCFTHSTMPHPHLVPALSQSYHRSPAVLPSTVLPFIATATTVSFALFPTFSTTSAAPTIESPL
ncbi:hypothetical protein DEO72_LG4g881 [Vigna unguiculata]|uniref:Uncharacterized protein n=1 Tax=Vigna unguiculata TaxID=3917 RepID=A0A4D6LMA6_VIGUN|nr:hypothetical protein DEO72_LG4g881 [Vigna unguiculata]